MAAVPPGYDQQGGYPPQQPGYPPQQQGYPPQQQGYPPATQYPPQPQYAPQQQSNTNVVVVGGGPSVQQTTVIQQPKEKVNHVLHLLITIFLFPPWVFVWMILCCIYGC
ncbi:cell death-inducing p53-target protein 1 homolog isoform X2 [Dysidea avara]|uniref:cell death-inducing p53-target protein 1 homolog isoform X2 n=1 Tax=Dysidea avara TaxID=196820 RepID=UPI0033347D99